MNESDLWGKLSSLKHIKWFLLSLLCFSFGRRMPGRTTGWQQKGIGLGKEGRRAIGTKAWWTGVWLETACARQGGGGRLQEELMESTGGPWLAWLIFAFFSLGCLSSVVGIHTKDFVTVCFGWTDTNYCPLERGNINWRKNAFIRLACGPVGHIFFFTVNCCRRTNPLWVVPYLGRETWTT